MFQKIKDIKKYIKLAKIGGAIFAVVFIALTASNVYMHMQVNELRERIERLENK